MQNSHNNDQLTNKFPGTKSPADARAIVPSVPTGQIANPPLAPPSTDAALPVVRSQLQRTASHVNGAKSRGPISEQGKKISSRNATTHGLAASSIRSVNLSQGDVEQYQKYLAEFGDEFRAKTASERVLVKEAAEAQILLDLISRVQSATMANIQANPPTPVLDQIEISARLLTRAIDELGEGRCVVSDQESDWILRTVQNYYSQPAARTQPDTSTRIDAPSEAEVDQLREVFAGRAELAVASRRIWQIRLRDTLSEYERSLSPADRLRIHHPHEYVAMRLMEALPMLERMEVYADRRRRVRDKNFNLLRELRRLQVELIEPAQAAPAVESNTVAALPDQS